MIDDGGVGVVKVVLIVVIILAVGGLDVGASNNHVGAAHASGVVLDKETVRDATSSLTTKHSKTKVSEEFLLEAGDVLSSWHEEVSEEEENGKDDDGGREESVLQSRERDGDGHDDGS